MSRREPSKHDPTPTIDLLGAMPEGIRPAVVRATVERALAAMGQPAGVTVRFASDRTVRRYNQQYRGIDRTTDVLSFAIEGELDEAPYLGDLLLSRDQIRRQARANGLTVERETQELLVHGILHLLGYDHETDDGRMNALELRLRRKLLDSSAAAEASC